MGGPKTRHTIQLDRRTASREDVDALGESRKPVTISDAEPEPAEVITLTLVPDYGKATGQRFADTASYPGFAEASANEESDRLEAVIRNIEVSQQRRLFLFAVIAPLTVLTIMATVLLQMDEMDLTLLLCTAMLLAYWCFELADGFVEMSFALRKVRRFLEPDSNHHRA